MHSEGWSYYDYKNCLVFGNCEKWQNCNIIFLFLGSQIDRSIAFDYCLWSLWFCPWFGTLFIQKQPSKIHWNLCSKGKLIYFLWMIYINYSPLTHQAVQEFLLISSSFFSIPLYRLILLVYPLLLEVFLTLTALKTLSRVWFYQWKDNFQLMNLLLNVRSATVWNSCSLG